VEGCHNYSQPEARSQTVDEVMAYVMQKTERNQELTNKFWETSDKKVCVGSSWGSYGIQITVWYKS
jgi:predicted Zn-dependent protease